MDKLYENIKSLRQKNKLTQTELAYKIGYSDKSMIAKIEKGLVDLPRTKIVQFAEVLGVTPMQLMGYSSNEPMEHLNTIITNKEKDLLNNFQRLNYAGQTKAIDYISDLADNPKYQLM